MKIDNTASFHFKPFSTKQKKVLTWWTDASPYKDHYAIIGDGAVRSGKTVSMSLSYVIWANEKYTGYNFGLCGKTIGSLRRNVVQPLKSMMKALGYVVQDKRADNLLIISNKGADGVVHSNNFYLFGGKDESSQDLIQGITLAGVFFDEVALMPQSFVNQATARCSVDGAKLFFNCNPESPYHWMKTEWIDKQSNKKVLYLHFTMDDNLSLSSEVKARYRSMYTGVFYKRYILGEWVLADGIIYDMFTPEIHVVDTLPQFIRYTVGVDYGTNNPCVYLLLGETAEGKLYVVKEYYYDGRNSSRQKTDAEYSRDMKTFLGCIAPSAIYVDPSASSFITQLRRDGLVVKEADNTVLDGIRYVSRQLAHGQLYVHSSCQNTCREFTAYCWDAKAGERGEDKPLKTNDHAMDALRYVLQTHYNRPSVGMRWL